MTKRVSAANAKAHLSALVAEVAFGGEQVIIERRGKPMAALVGLDEKGPKTGTRKRSPVEARGALFRLSVRAPYEELGRAYGIRPGERHRGTVGGC